MTTNAPRITWNGNILDFPYAVDKFDHDWRPQKSTTQSLAGATETITFRKLDHIRCRLKTHDSLAFHRGLYAWWAWASGGSPFSLSFDRADRVDTTVNGALAPVSEEVTNQLFNTWSSDTDADSWSESAPDTGGAINRVEDMRNVYSGDDGLSITSGGVSNGYLDQTITLSTSTDYRLQVRAKGSAAHKAFVRVQNDSTGNYLQDDLTWAGTQGVDNEPTFTSTTGDDFTTYTWDFTTEGSGTNFSVRVYIGGSSQGWAASDILYYGEMSIKERQKVTLTTTDGIVVGGAYRLRMVPANGLKEEIVVVAAVDSATVVELEKPTYHTYAATDVFRSVEHFPALYIPKSKQGHMELPTLVYKLDIQAVEYVS